jgi:hypothetical protein
VSRLSRGRRDRTRREGPQPHRDHGKVVVPAASSPPAMAHHQNLQTNLLLI